jgi:hypothetical protein
VKSARNWGDGHTTRSRHLIEDIQYRGDVSLLRCSDGALLTAPSPEALELAWQEHGGKLMASWHEDRVAPEPFVDDERSMSAMRILVALGGDCTCTPDSDIRDCPNFVADDLEEFPE